MPCVRTWDAIYIRLTSLARRESWIRGVVPNHCSGRQSFLCNVSKMQFARALINPENPKNLGTYTLRLRGSAFYVHEPHL